MLFRKGLLLILLLAPNALTGQPITLTFEDVLSGPYNFESIVTQGYQLQSWIYVSTGPDYCSPQCPANGGQYLLSQGGGAPIIISRLDGQPFSLLGFDYAEAQINLTPATRIVATGTSPSGTTVSAEFNVDGVDDGGGPLQDFQHATLPPSFANLRSVSIATDTIILFSLDNVTVASASVPAVPALGREALVCLIVLLGASGAWCAWHAE